MLKSGFFSKSLVLCLISASETRARTCFMLAVFAFKIKVSIILKMIQWNYQLTMQNWFVSYELCYHSTGFYFKIQCLRVRKVMGTFEKPAPGARFSKVPITFSGPKSCFMFAFKIKVSIILEIIQWNYQWTKQNWPVCETGTLLLFN